MSTFLVYQIRGLVLGSYLEYCIGSHVAINIGLVMQSGLLHLVSLVVLDVWSDLVICDNGLLILTTAYILNNFLDRKDY